MTRPSRTSTQPTRGFGVAVNNPRAARSSARRMNSRSRSSNAMSGCSRIRSARLAPRRRRLDFLQRVAKVCSILKAAIHRGEADVADLVDIFRRHRTLVQRPLKAIAYPAHVEVRARAILLHDLRQSQLGCLVGRETLLAGE